MDTHKILNALHFISLASSEPSKEPTEKTEKAVVSLAEQLTNATIQGGLSVFTTLSTIGALGFITDWKVAVVSGTIAFGLAFFTSLAIQRGLKK